MVFTAGGTESDNFAIRGAAEALEPTGRRHLIATAIEHEAVLNTLKALAARGWRVTLLPVDASGIVSSRRACARSITDDTALVSVMHANNEIGTMQPVAELAAIAKAHGALVHTDAVQTAGKVADRRQGARRRPAVDLGAQVLRPQGDRRAVAAKGRAAAALHDRRPSGAQSPRGHRKRPGHRRSRRRRRAGDRARWRAEAARLRALRDRLEAGILAAVAGAERNGAAEPRVPNTTNISFARIESESLLIGLDLEGIAVSSGSACSSGTLEPSHVLKAMGLPHARTLSSIRFSLGAGNTEADIDRVIRVLPPLVEKLEA